MISIETILLEFHELNAAELTRWIENAWIRPQGTPSHYHFHDIDLARIRLILDLRDQLDIDERAVPTILSLLDQLYETRRHVQRLHRVLAALPEDTRARLLTS